MRVREILAKPKNELPDQRKAFTWAHIQRTYFWERLFIHPNAIDVQDHLKSLHTIPLIE